MVGAHARNGSLRRVTPPVVELRECSKRFGERLALRRVSLRVEPGETVALVGPNGSGKSTLLRLVAGLARPDRGRPRGWTASRPPRRRRSCAGASGSSAHRALAYRGLTARENLALHARLHRRPATDVGRALERVGLARPCRRAHRRLLARHDAAPRPRPRAAARARAAAARRARHAASTWRARRCSPTSCARAPAAARPSSPRTTRPRCALAGRGSRSRAARWRDRRRAGPGPQGPVARGALARGRAAMVLFAWRRSCWCTSRLRRRRLGLARAAAGMLWLVVLLVACSACSAPSRPSARSGCSTRSCWRRSTARRSGLGKALALLVVAGGARGLARAALLAHVRRGRRRRPLLPV